MAEPAIDFDQFLATWHGAEHAGRQRHRRDPANHDFDPARALDLDACPPVSRRSASATSSEAIPCRRHSGATTSR
jgi:hypothetical protein